ncbi:hypothetical protein CROQUDRAFT_705276 [Cronartium quercuum f. sp. fusiforme G11]|uniref:Uncharacterized protein n=1 Tax=Cronartium quercuum f. sp. fusiforme G11 TaxID=708437 RepID=A0A9P6NEY8_9BASI|nr:hypothetical protein CROQUDRAFT_705276 [Cronartium quercuum f. sp. fusiforme G11]
MSPLFQKPKSPTTELGGIGSEIPSDDYKIPDPIGRPGCCEEIASQSPGCAPMLTGNQLRPGQQSLLTFLKFSSPWDALFFRKHRPKPNYEDLPEKLDLLL